jgi:hypothetical protein
VGASIHACHFGGLDLPILRIILDDAERVYPDVADTQRTSQDDGVFDGLGECVLWDGRCKLGQVFVLKLHLLGVAPAVAEGGELGVWSWEVDKSQRRVGCCADVNQTCRCLSIICSLDSAADGVVYVTPREPG